jgi:hypothetical protein
MRVHLEIALKDSDETLFKTELCAKALIVHAALLLRQRYLPYGSEEVALANGEQDTPWAHIQWAATE